MATRLDVFDRIANLERQIARLWVVCISLAVALGVVFISNRNSVQAQSSDRILRARGLVIEDEAGRERVLIGAPIPSASHRVRTDEMRVRELWAKRYPNADRYMEFYKGYQHATNGILVLDENGFDRVALGDPVPDPNIGKRIGPSTGIVINDEQGFERSGYGLLKVDGRYRVVLGLDSARGSEGATLSLSDEGATGLTVRDGQRVVFMGSAPSGTELTGLADPFHGLLVRGAEGVKFIANASSNTSQN